ncbi:MAG: CRISPR-associated endonuclease Cas1 [Gammaproteobacteria bacterium]
MSENPLLRTLYLDGHRRLRVLLDGPALRIRRDDSADHLFPLRHLVQVVTCGPVEWSISALLACAEASVPVIFFRANGCLRARVLGEQACDRLLDLDLALSALLDQPSGPDRYNEWIQARTQQARLKFLHMAGRRCAVIESSTVQRLIQNRARLHVRAGELRRFDRQIYGLLQVNIDTLMREYGLDPDRAGLTVQGIDITRDFTNILIWSLQSKKLRYFKRLHGQARRKGNALARLDWFQAVQFIEQNAGHITDQFRETIKQFHAHLLETVRGNVNQ